MKETLHFLNENRKFLFLSFFLSILIPILILSLSKDSYRAYATVAPSEDSSASGISSLLSSVGGGIVPGFIGGDSSSAQIALATLNSKIFINEFVEKHNLILAIDNPLSQWDIHEEMMERLEIEKSTGSVLMNIYFEHEDPSTASEVVNNLIRDLNSYLRDKELIKANKNIATYKEEIAKTDKVEELNTLYILLESEISRQVMLKNEDEYALKIIDPSKIPESKAWPNYVMIIISALVSFLLMSMLFLGIIYAKKTLTESNFS